MYPIQEEKEEEWWPRWKRRDRDDVAEALRAVRAAEETRQVRKAAERALGRKEATLSLLEEALGGHLDQMNNRERRAPEGEDA